MLQHDEFIQQSRATFMNDILRPDIKCPLNTFVICMKRARYRGKLQQNIIIISMTTHHNLMEEPPLTPVSGWG